MSSLSEYTFGSQCPYIFITAAFLLSLCVCAFHFSRYFHGLRNFMVASLNVHLNIAMGNGWCCVGFDAFNFIIFSVGII